MSSVRREGMATDTRFIWDFPVDNFGASHVCAGMELEVGSRPVVPFGACQEEEIAMRPTVELRPIKRQAPVLPKTGESEGRSTGSALPNAVGRPQDAWLACSGPEVDGFSVAYADWVCEAFDQRRSSFPKDRGWNLPMACSTDALPRSQDPLPRAPEFNQQMRDTVSLHPITRIPRF
jgi:hypothetical protein